VAWFTKTWFPKLAREGLKAIITVMPKSAIAQLATKSWQAVEQGGIKLQNVTGLKEAEALIPTLSK
jgi:hypothetical protein